MALPLNYSKELLSLLTGQAMDEYRAHVKATYQKLHSVRELPESQDEEFNTQSLDAGA